MNLVIGENEYPLLEAITEAKLSDLLTVAKESKRLGAEVSIKQLRDYVSNDILKSTDGFAFVDGGDRVISLLSLVYLCRRHIGEDVTFSDGETVQVDQLRLSVTVEDEAPGEADPKAPTDSAPAADAAETTT